MKRSLHLSLGLCLPLIFDYALQLNAQKTSQAIVPSQFATAKTVFVSFSGGDTFFERNTVILAAIQDALTTERHDTIVSAPREAELSMRLSVEALRFLRITIFDTKTGMLLWEIQANYNPSGLTKNKQKKLKQAADELMSQLETLASGNVPETTPY